MEKHLYITFITLFLSFSSPMIVGSQSLMAKEEKKRYHKKRRNKIESDYESNSFPEHLKRKKSGKSIPPPLPIIDIILNYFVRDASVRLSGKKVILPSDLINIINMQIERIVINAPLRKKYIAIFNQGNNLFIKGKKDDCWLKVIGKKTFPIKGSEGITDFLVHKKDLFGIQGEKYFLIERENSTHYSAKEQVELVGTYKEPKSPFYSKIIEIDGKRVYKYGSLRKDRLGKYKFIPMFNWEEFHSFYWVTANIFSLTVGMDYERKISLCALNRDGSFNKKNFLELRSHPDSEGDDCSFHQPHYVISQNGFFAYLLNKGKEEGWYKIEVGKDEKLSITKKEGWGNYYKIEPYDKEGKKIFGFSRDIKYNFWYHNNDVATKAFLLEPSENKFLGESCGFLKINNLLLSHDSFTYEDNGEYRPLYSYFWTWSLIKSIDSKTKKRILPKDLQLEPKNLVSIKNHIFGTSLKGDFYKLSIEGDPNEEDQKFVKIANSLGIENLIEIKGEIMGYNGKKWLEYDDSQNQFIDSIKYKNHGAAQVSVPNGMEMINMKYILSHDVAEYTIK